MAEANDYHESIFLLMNGLGGCINKLWKKFTPSNLDYSVSEKIELEMLYLFSPILENLIKLFREILQRNSLLKG